MSLTSCHECGQQISNRAISHPGCHAAVASEAAVRLVRLLHQVKPAHYRTCGHAPDDRQAEASTFASLVDGEAISGSCIWTLRRA